MKNCTRCKADKPLADFHRNRSRADGVHSHCKTCVREYANSPKVKESQRRWRESHRDTTRATMKAWTAANKDRVAAHKLWTFYRLTPEQYDELLMRQDGRCAICPTTVPGGAGKWHVDHDHACCPGGKSCGQCVRGLLCSRCNVGIGMLGDSPERLGRAAAYISEASDVRLEGFQVQ